MAKHRDTPLSATPDAGIRQSYGKQEPPSRVLQKEPVAKFETTNVSVNKEKLDTDMAATEKKQKRATTVKNVKTFGKILGAGAATLVGGYYALTKPAGNKLIYRQPQTGQEWRTPKKRNWRWEGDD